MSNVINFNDIRAVCGGQDNENDEVVQAITGESRNSKEPTLAEHLNYAADALELIAHNLRVAVAQMQKGKLR